VTRQAAKAVRRRRLPARARRAARRAFEEEIAHPSGPAADAERLGPMYAAGPAMRLDPAHADAGKQAQAGGDKAGQRPAAPARSAEVAPIPQVAGSGPTTRQSNAGQSVRLEGRTDATFDGGSFRTENVRVERASGCTGCAAADCGRARGDLVAVYSVATVVSLPSVNDFPDLRPCQRQRVQDAITNVLAPHERQHVTAFRAYNGTTRTPFDVTLCHGDFDAAMQSMFQAQEQARRAAAQAASDALDPFHFDVDLDCVDRPARRSATSPRISANLPNEEDQV
jgi:hypothetical protein